MHKSTLQFAFNRPWSSKNSHALTSLLRKALLDVCTEHRLILRIGIRKGAAKLGPPPLRPRVHDFLFNKFSFGSLTK